MAGSVTSRLELPAAVYCDGVLHPESPFSSEKLAIRAAKLAVLDGSAGKVEVFNLAEDGKRMLSSTPSKIYYSTEYLIGIKYDSTKRRPLRPG